MDKETKAKIDESVKKLQKAFPKRPAPSPFAKINKERHSADENDGKMSDCC